MTAKQKAARAKFKAVVKEAGKLRKKNPKLTQAQAVKQAWAISYSKKRAGVGAVKKKAAKKKAATKVKAKKSKSTEMHTDTKSHNVNIRVISGISENVINKLQKAIEEYNMAESQVILHRGNLPKLKKGDFTYNLNKKIISDNIKLKKELSKHIKNLKKLINV